MSNTEFQKIKDDAQKIRMTAAEKQRIFQYVITRPPTASPLSPYDFISSSNSFFSMNSWLHRHTWVAPVAVLLVVVIGVQSLVFSAEKALPGNALYGLKVNVNESVRDFVTITAAGEAEWEAEKAGRRLSEAALLATTGTLDQEKQEYLIQLFDTHTVAFVESLKRVRAGSHPERAHDISVSFEERLKGQAESLGAFDSSTSLAADVAPANEALTSSKMAVQRFAAEQSTDMSLADTIRSTAAMIRAERDSAEKNSK